jgi:hypothetical protein
VPRAARRRARGTPGRRGAGHRYAVTSPFHADKVLRRLHSSTPHVPGYRGSLLVVDRDVAAEVRNPPCQPRRQARTLGRSRRRNPARDRRRPGSTRNTRRYLTIGSEPRGCRRGKRAERLATDYPTQESRCCCARFGAELGETGIGERESWTRVGPAGTGDVPLEPAAVPRRSDPACTNASIDRIGIAWAIRPAVVDPNRCDLDATATQR